MHDTHNDNHEHEHSQSFVVKLLDKKQVAEGTMMFIFERPEGLEFKAGQHAQWTLTEPPETDAEGNSRMFSLASSPSEEELVIATRMRDTAFKRVLGRMNSGDTLEVANPHGSFTLHNDTAKAAIFLIGGIGITPALSIIKDATEKNLPHKIYLFYANRRLEDTAFFQELKELAEKNNHFTFVPTMTQPDSSTQNWDGETGYINREMVKKYVPDLDTAIYYLSGPERMVAAMRKILNEAGINEDFMKTEEFTGY